MRIFLLSFFVIISCSSIENETNMYSRAGLPDQESWDVEITLTDEGVMRALVKAGHLEKFNERNYIFLNKNVDVDFFDEEEIHTTNLKSMIAEIDEKTNFMTAIENVVAMRANTANEFLFAGRLGFSPFIDSINEGLLSTKLNMKAMTMSPIKTFINVSLFFSKKK